MSLIWMTFSIVFAVSFIIHIKIKLQFVCVCVLAEFIWHSKSIFICKLEWPLHFISIYHQSLIYLEQFRLSNNHKVREAQHKGKFQLNFTWIWLIENNKEMYCFKSRWEFSLAYYILHSATMYKADIFPN